MLRKRLEDSALGYSKTESLEEQRIQKRRTEMDVSMCNHNTYTLRQVRSLFKEKKKNYHDVFKVVKLTTV